MTKFYTLTLNRDLLYDSRVVVPDGLIHLTDCHNIQLQRSVNSHGKLDFTLPFTHNLYLDASNPTSRVTVDASDHVGPLLTGILLRTKTFAMGTRTFTYAGVSILLTRIKQRPFTYTGTLRGFLDFLLTRHNQAAGPDNTWVVGVIAGFDPTTPVEVSFENPTSTWDVLISVLTGDEGMGGYLLPHATGDTLILDVSDTSGPLSNQTVTLTSNIIDFDAVMDLSTLTTRLYPLGAPVTTTTEDGTGSDRRERLTIAEVNNGVDYLQDDDLVALLGVREDTVMFDKTDDPYELKMRTAERLAKLKLAGFTAHLSVADLSLLSLDYDAFTCGDQVPFDCPEYGLSDTAIITDTLTWFDNPTGSTLTIGAERPTLITSTQRTADQVTRIATSTARLNERMVQVSSSQAEIQMVLDTTREAVAAAEARSAVDRESLEAARRDAAEAKDAAEEAIRQAAVAVGVAGGKVEFWTETVAPPVECQRTTVLWIDTADGVTVLRRWDGAGWVPIQDPAAVEAAVVAEAAEDRANASAQAAQAAQAEAEASSATAEAARQASVAAQASAQASASSASEASTLASSAKQAAAEAVTASAKATSDAAAAQRAADQAAQDAADAAGLANGKSDVVIQLDPPGTALRKATTLWIDTTGGANTPKKWSGTAWMAVTDKAATDAAAAAVAAKTSADKAQSTAEAAQGLANSAQASADLAQSYASAAGMGGANIVIDPSFENPAVWTPDRIGSSGLTFDTSDAHTGTQCGKIPAGKNTRKFSMTPVPIPVQPGQVWRIKAWMKSSSDLAGATEGNTKIRLAKADDSWVGDVATNTVGTQWTVMGWDAFVIPAGVTRLDVQVCANFTSGCQWIDDLEIVNITDVSAAQTAADAAWAAAAQSNLIRDPCFHTSSATDSLTNGASETSLANLAATTLVFNASGFAGALPSPASTYGRTTANNSTYSRGVAGGANGLPTTGGKTYRLSIDIAHAATIASATHTFQLRVSSRKGTTWSVATIGPAIAPSATADTSFRTVSALWTVPDGVDAFRPGFGSYASTGTNSEWWVTNWQVCDVTEAVAAQKVADRALTNALAATDSYARDASQGLEGITFESSTAGVQAVTTVVDADGALKGKAISKPASTAGTLWIHDTLGRIPLKQGVLYEVFATIRVPTQTPAATGTCYVGVDGLRQVDGAWQFVNLNGANSSSSQHYVALSGKTVTAGVWTTGRGYFTVSASSKTTGHGAQANDPSKPATIHPTATHVQPMILMSYSGKADQVEISDWGITAVPVSTAQKAVDAKVTADKAVTNAAAAQAAATTAQTTADTAKTLADQAKEDAASAAGIAGGKADVLIQTATPAESMRKATTLWIDTTSGANTPKRWDSATSKWVAVTDKAAQDAASAAATAKTAADKAQTTADTAKTNAATAQARADEAKAVADQAGLDAQNLAVTVSTVQSNISQLPSQILSEVDAKYVSTTAAQKTTEVLRSEMSQTAQGIDVRIKQVNETVTSVSGAVVAETAAREALIRMGANGVEVGASDSPAKSVYGADGMKITVNGVEVANYTSTGAENSQMLIRDRLQIGNRIIEPNPAGGLWIRGV